MSEVRIEPIDLTDEEDIKFLFQTRSHSDVCKYLLGRPPADLDSHRCWLKANVPIKRLMYLLKYGVHRIGYCHVYDFHNKPTAEVGFVVHPDYQGRGFGRMMVGLFIDEVRRLFPDKKIILYVKLDNHRAIRLYELEGFIPKEEKDGQMLYELGDVK